MKDSAEQIIKLRQALAEVLARRNVFSDDTYTQIILAIYDKIRDLQTRPQEEAPHVGGSDEIRLVTVMFVDVVDSTALAQQVEADDWKMIIGEAHRTLSDIIEAWDGEIGQYLGDGLLCFFGAHRSQGNDALRAVACGLIIQEAMHKFSQRIRKKYGFDFALRIAMSTGRVVVGMIGGGGKRELLALGTPTNLASRLQNLCEPGKVLIDASTYHRVRSHFITHRHPVRQIKGFEDPIEYFTVVERRQARPPHLTDTRVAGIQTPFVGRNREIARLLDLLELVTKRGYFHVLTISGDIGVGKSRLTQEALVQAERFGFAHLVLSGDYEKRNTAFNLLHNLLLMHCDVREDTPAEVAETRILQFISQSWPHPDAEAVAEVMGYLGGFGFEDRARVRSLRAGDIEQRQVAFDLLAHWFHHRADESPLLLVVDNLQWVDADSLQLLEHVVSRLNGTTGLLIGMARPEFAHTQPNYMRRATRHTETILDRLHPTDTAILIASILQHVDNVPDPLPALINERAEGNPLFVEEFLHMLFDNGIFEPIGSEHWRVNLFQYATMSFSLPNGLVGLLQARLDDLPGLTRRVAQVAAVIGQVFWDGAITHILHQDNIQRQLIDLEKRGIIVRSQESNFDQEHEYHFRHSLYQEVAYSMLTRTNREVYHQDFAGWLARRIQDRPDDLPLLADHYLRGQQNQMALHTYYQAAVDRYQRGLLADTLKLIETGLSAARQVPREIALPVVSKLWLTQGQAMDGLNRYREACAASDTALKLMDELPPDDMIIERVTAARTLGSANLNLGQYAEAFTALNRALALLPKENRPQHAAVLRTFGRLFWSRGELDRSLEYTRQALALSRGSQDHREQARIASILAAIALDRGAFVEALEYTEQMLDINRADGNLYYQVLDLRQLVSIYRGLLAYEMALEICDEADALGSRIHYRDPLVAVNRGLCLLELGDREAGIDLLRRVAADDHQNAHTHALVRLALAHGLALYGDFEACQAQAAELAAATHHQNFVIYGRSLLWLGVAQNALGDPAATGTLEAALDHEKSYGGRDLWMCSYALAMASADDEARRQYSQATLDQLLHVANSLDGKRPLLKTMLLQRDIFNQLHDSLQQHTG